ncbi:MAG: hypothetical protein J7L88_00765, partial [Thermoplasmata archaeon]|nr:hypothetical protein [Thermoplasmata archaeon]
MKGRVEIRTRIYPTESLEKVKDAILNIFPDAEFALEGEELVGRAEELDTFLDI